MPALFTVSALSRAISQYMRCSDASDVIVITRRHVGCILSVNGNRAKYGNLKILIPMLCADHVFRPCFFAYNSHTQQLASARKFTTRYTAATSIPPTWWRAVTVVNRMT